MFDILFIPLTYRYFILFQYLEEHENKEHIDVDEMVDDLQKAYKDYSRKKRGPFKSVVEKG